MEEVALGENVDAQDTSTGEGEVLEKSDKTGFGTVLLVVVLLAGIVGGLVMYRRPLMKFLGGGDKRGAYHRVTGTNPAN